MWLVELRRIEVFEHLRPKLDGQAFPDIEVIVMREVPIQRRRTVQGSPARIPRVPSLGGVSASAPAGRRSARRLVHASRLPGLDQSSCPMPFGRSAA